MRRIIVAAAATTLIGSVVAACGSTSSSSPASGSSSASGSAASCTHASIQNELYTKGVLTVATDNPVYTPWFVKNKPSNGKGYESAVAYAIAAPARLLQLPGGVGHRAVQQLVRSRTEEVRLRHQRGLLHAAARAGGHVLQQLLRRAAGHRGAQGLADRHPAHHGRPEEVPVRRPGRDHRPHLHHQRHPADPAAQRSSTRSARCPPRWRRTGSTR